jgi:hypothetical protein
MKLRDELKNKSITEIFAIRQFAYEMVNKYAGRGSLTMKWIDVKEAANSVLEVKVLEDLGIEP